MTVNISRDWIDWLLFSIQVVSVVAAAAAVGIATWAIIVAKRQALDADKALVRERRLDFELNILKDLVVAVQRVDLRINVKALALMLPATDIPLTRAAAGLEADEQAMARVRALDESAAKWPMGAIGHLATDISAELTGAIVKRIERRGRG